MLVLRIATGQRVGGRKENPIGMVDKHITGIHSGILVQHLATFLPTEPAIAVVVQIFFKDILAFVPLFAPEETRILIKVIVIDLVLMRVNSILPFADNERVGMRYLKLRIAYPIGGADSPFRATAYSKQYLLLPQ